MSDGATRQSEMNAGLVDLRKLINDARTMTEDLQVKLSPVMRPVGPSVDEKAPEPGQPATPMAQEMYELSGNLRVVCRILRDIHNHLEV